MTCCGLFVDMAVLGWYGLGYSMDINEGVARWNM
jgi:hypothetical protein